MIELVQGLLSDEDGNVQKAAGNTMAKLGAAAEDAVAKCIPGAPRGAMLGWLEGLQELGPEAATPQRIELIQRLIADSDFMVREQAEEILPKLLAAAKEVRTAK